MNPEPDVPLTTVLYVEDDAANRDLMRAVLGKRPGLRLVTARLGSEALDAAVAERPALILLDRNLPDMTGAEILHLLAVRDETATVPVVVVSGDTALPRAGESERGVIAYLTKPIDVRQLLEIIDGVMHPGGRT